MGLAERREKDQALAARMKREGVKREVCRCPICHEVVSLKLLYGHVVTHPRRDVYGYRPRGR